MCRKGLWCVAFACFVCGCADLDDEAHLRCVQGALRPDEAGAAMRTNISALCDASVDEFVGVWDSINLGESVRFVFEANGKYTFWAFKRARWWKQYEGEHWIEYHLGGEMYRPELHMRTPDLDDYCVRYHMVDDVVHFEEPMYGMKTIQ